MIARTAAHLTKALSRYVSMTEDEAEVYQYGFDIALYTLLSTAALLAIGALAGEFVSTVVCISLFYLNQTVGGGYHANSHLGCFLTMVLGLFLYLILHSCPLASGIYYLCSAASFCVLMLKPLVLHKNKRHLQSQRRQFELRSRLAVLLEMLLLSLLIVTHQEKLVSAFSLSLLLCAVSRIAAWLISRKENTL